MVPCPAAGTPHLVTPPSGSSAATSADAVAAPPSEPAAIPPAGVIGRLAAALSYRDFRVLWMGACTSSVGTWMQEVAQNWLVLELTNSAKYLALDAFLGELPILLFTLIGGVVADRQDRRKVLLASQVIQMASAFALAGLVLSHRVEVWHVLVLSFVTGCAQAFGGPAYQSLIPSLVRKEHLPNAIALNSIQFNIARVLGPLPTGPRSSPWPAPAGGSGAERGPLSSPPGALASESSATGGERISRGCACPGASLRVRAVAVHML